MSIISFSIPSDQEILNKVIKKNCEVFFIGKGKIVQNMTETLYERKVKTIFNDKEILQKVIYVKKGTQWLFNTIETISNR